MGVRFQTGTPEEIRRRESRFLKYAELDHFTVFFLCFLSERTAEKCTKISDARALPLSTHGVLVATAHVVILTPV